MSRSLYLIKRGPRPEYHRAPFHPIIICDKRSIAMWEAGDTNNRSWVWCKDGWDDNHHGWLLLRWEGLDIDYGGLVKAEHLPDGSPSAFYRDYLHHAPGEGCVHDLFAGAVWWSNKQMPEWLSKRGTIYPPDDFTQKWILDRVRDEGAYGTERPEPGYWTVPTEPKP